MCTVVWICCAARPGNPRPARQAARVRKLPANETQWNSMRKECESEDRQTSERTEDLSWGPSTQAGTQAPVLQLQGHCGRLLDSGDLCFPIRPDRIHTQFKNTTTAAAAAKDYCLVETRSHFVALASLKLCRPDWPQTHRDPAAVAFQVLWLKACSTKISEWTNEYER